MLRPALEAPKPGGSLGDQRLCRGARCSPWRLLLAGWEGEALGPLLRPEGQGQGEAPPWLGHWSEKWGWEPGTAIRPCMCQESDVTLGKWLGKLCVEDGKRMWKSWEQLESAPSPLRIEACKSGGIRPHWE